MSKTRQVLGKVLPVFRNEFNSLTQYEQLDIVTYEGSTYIAKQDTQGNLPTNTTYFALLVQKPIKGTDYFTQEEIDDIVDEVIEDATNTFNQNVVTKTNEFNTNATNKTSAFNDNYDSKVSSFNSNATSKVNDFNSNYSDKVSSFNSHVNDKKDEIDTYVGTKETAFDSHVSGKIDDFDSNATSKTTAFNTNATSKTNDFNSNASAKTTEFNNNAEYIEKELDKYKTMYNVLPKVENDTLSSEVELDGTGEAYMKVKPYGKVSQESTTGKNLFDISKVLTNGNLLVNNGNTLTINAPSSDTSVKGLSPNTLHDYCPNLRVGDIVYLNAKTTGQNKFIYLDIPADTWNFGSSRTITQNDLDSSVRWYSSGTNTSATISEIMVSTSSDTTYEPYTGGQPSPNHDYPQNIKVVTGDNNVKITNKNLINNHYYYDRNGKVAIDISNLEIGKIYTLSTNVYIYGFKISTHIYGYNSVKNLSNVPKKLYTFVMAKDSRYSESDTQYLFLAIGWENNSFVFSGDISDLDNVNVQVEQGSTSTNYVKGNSQNYSLNLGNLEMYEGDYFFKNTIDDENYDSNLDLNAWYLKNYYAKITDSSGSTGITINDMVSNGNFKSYYGGTLNDKTITYDNPISGTNTIVYKLATPTYTKITDSTLIGQLEALNSATSCQEKTYITCTSSSADNETLDVKAVALKDIQAMFDETNNAIIEIGGE